MKQVGLPTAVHLLRSHASGLFLNLFTTNLSRRF